MNRRGFLGALLAGTGALILAEPEIRRVYSMPSQAELWNLEFERDMERSAAERRPGGRGKLYRVSRDVRLPPGAWLDGAYISLERRGRLVGAGKVSITWCHLAMANNHYTSPGERSAIAMLGAPAGVTVDPS